MSKLQHIRSATPDKRPDPALLVDGQLAINTASATPGFYTKNDAGGLVKIGPTFVGSAAPNSSPGGSAGNSVGEHWMDTSVAPPVLRVWDGSSWIASQGLTGPQGAAGIDGAAGAQGPAGAQGEQGIQGQSGIGIRYIGEVATVAELPATGNVQGDLWVIGNRADDASPAESYIWNEGTATWTYGGKIQGPQGPAGAAGAAGIDGAAGAQGPAGVDGAQGPAGVDGAAGGQGAQGEVGPQGGQGPAGADGAAGAQGPAGVDGAAGGQGAQGEVGPQGPPGADGAAGGQGPQGEVGPQGEQGSQGSSGTGIRYAGEVATVAELPTTGNAQGDLWVIGNRADDTSPAESYIWNEGTATWTYGGKIQGPQGPAGTPADTSAFVQKIGDTMTGQLIINTAAGATASLVTDEDIVINTNRFGSGGGSQYSCTAVGSVALRDNCAGGVQDPDGGYWLGSDNTAIGTEVLLHNTTGSSNSAIGKNALHFNLTGHDNAAIGTYSLQYNVSGKQNTACGKGALYNNVDGMNNASVGAYSMFDNISGSFNTAIGPECLKGNTSGNHNVAAGSGALRVNTVGTGNTSIGTNTLQLSNGNHNTAIGVEAGTGGGGNPLSNTTGSNNIFIGVMAVGAAPDESNVITLGNGGISALRCQVQAITALSDARDKTDVSNIPAGLSFINALRPVAFKWNTRDGAKVGIPEFGFIAQELLEVQASTGITVPNLVSTVNPDKLEASAGTLLPVLVNAIQELTVMVKTLQTELSTLKGA